MKILHISAECYPAAKAGGLGDVVGALPKYLQQAGENAAVIIPKYGVKWIQQRHFQPVYSGAIRMHNGYIHFQIERETGDSLGFPFFVANIPGKFDRPGIYNDPNGWGYGDDTERWLAFQQAVLHWIMHTPGQPDILHCHDHHTGLIPFMVRHCPEYQSLRNIPTVFTIHNGTYHGAFSWQKLYLMPFFDAEARGLLDWADTINPLAAAVKCAWRVTTVSPSYLEELRHDSNGMEPLFWHEQHKCVGILNGIDAEVWDPRSDPYLSALLQGDQLDAFKGDNKKALRMHFNFDPEPPLVVFVGRLVMEKGADLIPDLIRRALQSGMRASFLILGTGEARIAHDFDRLRQEFRGRVDARLEYNEGIAHQLYAGADFLLMPSRVEPCGLNQFYAMRYGSIPIVRKVGGLQDSVPDICEPDGQGRGIQFSHLDLDDAYKALYRALEFVNYYLEDFQRTRYRNMQLDFSWERSASQSLHIYLQLL
jgi:starch synthase